jgi:CHAD domain-containing protein
MRPTTASTVTSDARRRASDPDAVLARRIDALAAHLADAVDAAPRAVHQARVATRRLRELVPVLTTHRHQRRGRRLQKRLRAVGRGLGPLRELDVAIGLLDERARGAGAATAGIRAAKAALTTAREDARAGWAGGLDREGATRLVDKLRRLEQRVREDGATKPAPSRLRRRVLAARLTERARDLAGAVSTCGALLVVERVHAVRIAAKRLRYVLELVAELRLAPVGSIVGRLKTLQDTLGALHDLDVLRHHVARVRAAEIATSARATGLETFTAGLDADIRALHARYLRRARTLPRLTDRLRDEVAPCLARSTSISSATPSLKSAARRGPTTASARSRPTASAGGASRRRGSPRSGRARTSS